MAVDPQFLSLVLSFFALFVGSNGKDYMPNDKVDIFVNKVGPYSNPHETYLYYSLPLCPPSKITFKSMSVSQALDGNKLAYSDFDVKFAENSENKKLCDVSLTPQGIAQLRDAIEKGYYFEFFIDDIPFGGYVGLTEETNLIPHTHKLYLYTSLTFKIYHNAKQILAVVPEVGEPVDMDKVVPGERYPFVYSVKWESTTQSAEEIRAELTRSKRKFDNVHWISIVNSVVLNVLLIVFISAILTKTLGKDIETTEKSGEEGDSEDDVAWKHISADVFRFPKFKRLFCAILGAGAQFLALVSGLVIMGMLHLFDVSNHGAATSTGCILFALTSVVAGFVSGSMYKKMDGDRWLSLINITGALFVGPFFAVWGADNLIAWSYDSTQALPFYVIISLVALWMFVGYPLTVVGSILGKNLTSTFEPPCRIKNVPREIPPSPCYASLPGHLLFGGFLPCSAIAVELYYIFGAVWGRQDYSLYGLMLAMLIMLVSISACVSICLTYSLLVAEDYRWWWRSVFNLGASAGFVFMYAIIYAVQKTHISGILQISQFLSWSLLTCYAFFLAVGTVSFFASFTFVKYIYRSVKLD